MKKKADITLNQGKLQISGVLNFSNVMSVYQASLPLISTCHELFFDFSQLKSSDSSTIALMLEWSKLAKKQHKNISFSAISTELQSIMRVAGLNQLFV